MMEEPEKQAVHDFWNAAACGEKLHLPDETLASYEQQAAARYALEPEILGFADFARWRGRRVLEIGVGLGADHARFAQAGAELTGIDLTERAIAHARRRLALLGLSSSLQVGDAERLPFADNTFDLVYSWGVLHHTPDTPRAFAEVARVLRPGGVARIMIYHKYSMIGYMLWTRYALLRLRPWTSLRAIYARYLESPGTKAYSVAEARVLCRPFREAVIRSQLGWGDLLLGRGGQRHRGPLLSVARVIWPRWFIRRCLRGHGLTLLLEATK
jgi:ubiquinone/menaquinone biosynthesis C-methylase UbiE